MYPIRIFPRRTPTISRFFPPPIAIRTYVKLRPGLTPKTPSPLPRASPHPVRPITSTPRNPSPNLTTPSPFTSHNLPNPTNSTLSGQVETVELTCAPGITLTGNQRMLVGALLDLYKAQVTRQKLEIWAPDAEFETIFGKAVGRKQVEAQWWAMDKIMEDVKVLRHKVLRSDETGFELELEIKYVVKGIGASYVVESVVEVEVDESGEKVRRCVDKWKGGESHSKILEAVKRAAAIVTEKLTRPPAPGSN